MPFSRQPFFALRFHNSIDGQVLTGESRGGFYAFWQLGPDGILKFHKIDFGRCDAGWTR
jgi:hypothetical protein